MADRKRQRRRRRPLLAFLGWTSAVLAAIILFFIFSPAAGSVAAITDGAMNPSLEIGDRISVDRLSYMVRDPGRGDIIEFFAGGGTELVRRVVGLPGETIQIQNGQIYINGMPLDESDYAVGTMQYAGTVSLPVTLPQDEYFVMADNRDSNFDSRDPTVGNISKADITGRLWLRISPGNRFGLIR